MSFDTALQVMLFVPIGVFLTIFALTKLIQLCSFVQLYVLARPLQLGKRLDAYGRWAIITGASDGIGKEYAFQLARRGLNIALVARNRTKLETVAHQIARETGRQTEVFVIDFARAANEEYQQLEHELTPLLSDTGVLVNNVGLGVEVVARYHEYPPKEILLDMINTNMTSAVMMSKIVLPGMCQRKEGVIINVSSAAGCRPPTGISAIYPQTKRFLRALSEGLADEYEKDGIIVQSVCPSLVRTNMTTSLIEQAGEKMANLMSVDAASYVAWALSQVGLARETFGHPRHAVTIGMIQMMPYYLYKNMLNKFLLTGVVISYKNVSSGSK